MYFNFYHHIKLVQLDMQAKSWIQLYTINHEKIFLSDIDTWPIILSWTNHFVLRTFLLFIFAYQKKESLLKYATWKTFYDTLGCNMLSLHLQNTEIFFCNPAWNKKEHNSLWRNRICRLYQWIHCKTTYYYYTLTKKFF